jgi:hypothetical protein
VAEWRETGQEAIKDNLLEDKRKMWFAEIQKLDIKVVYKVNYHQKVIFIDPMWLPSDKLTTGLKKPGGSGREITGVRRKWREEWGTCL